MSDLFRVHVEACDDTTARLRLQIINLDQVTFPLSRGFAMMLLQDGSAPGHDRCVAWQNEVAMTDPELDTWAHLVSVRLIETRGLPREQGKPPAGLTRDDVDDSDDRGVLGEALYELVVDAPGMLGHLAVGDTWGTTAYDVTGKGLHYCGGSGDPTEWRRG